MNHKVRLSQCMIVKNEEKNIERALSWGKDIMWEQIVVDTGSTDRTVEIAEKMGAKIFHFKWIDDFSAAKNYAIEQAKGNWIAFLDADEYLNEKDTQKIYAIISEIERVNPELKPHILRTALVDLKEDKSVNGITVQDRFFRNLPEVRYQNSIHEFVAIKEGRLIVCNLTEEISVFHTGYTKAVYEDTKKIDRNIEMLKKNLDENPEDLNTAAYLAESLKSGNKTEEAEVIYRRVILNRDSSMHLARLTNAFYGLMHIITLREDLEEEEELKQLYEEAIKCNAAFPDYDYLMGVWYFRKGHFIKAIEYLENSLNKLEVYQDVNTTYVPTVLPDIYTAICRASIEIGDPSKSVRYCILALRLNRYTDVILNTLLDELHKNGEKARDCYDLLAKIYDFTTLKDKLYVIKAAKLVAFEELDIWINNQITEEERRILQKK